MKCNNSDPNDVFEEEVRNDSKLIDNENTELIDNSDVEKIIQTLIMKL